MKYDNVNIVTGNWSWLSSIMALVETNEIDAQVIIK